MNKPLHLPFYLSYCSSVTHCITWSGASVRKILPSRFPIKFEDSSAQQLGKESPHRLERGLSEFSSDEVRDPRRSKLSRGSKERYSEKLGVTQRSYLPDPWEDVSEAKVPGIAFLAELNWKTCPFSKRLFLPRNFPPRPSWLSRALVPLQVSHLPPDPSSGQKWSLHQAEVMGAINISNSAGNHGGHSHVPHISLRHSWDFREDVSWGAVLPLQAVLSLVSNFAFPSPFQSQGSLCLPWPEQEDSANPVRYNQLQQSYSHSLFTLKMPCAHSGETHGLHVWVIRWWLSLGVT